MVTMKIVKLVNSVRNFIKSQGAFKIEQVESPNATIVVTLNFVCPNGVSGCYKFDLEGNIGSEIDGEKTVYSNKPSGAAFAAVKASWLAGVDSI